MATIGKRIIDLDVSGGLLADIVNSTIEIDRSGLIESEQINLQTLFLLLGSTSEIGSFLGSAIDGSRQITITHILGRNIYDIGLLKSGLSIDKSNFHFENIDTANVKITCNFPYVSGDTINYKLS